MRNAFSPFLFASALLLASCASKHRTSDVVHSRFSLGPDASEARRLFTASLGLAGTISSSDGVTSPPTVTPTFSIEVEAIGEDEAASAEFVLVVAIDDGPAITVPFERAASGRREARTRTSITCPREWRPCIRVADVSIERADASTDSSAFSVSVRTSSRYRSGRRDLGYEEFAEVVRVEIP